MRFSLSTVIMTLLAGPASAAVIRVPEDVGSIQDALDGARDGDTIIASAGEYAVQSPLRFAGKGVTLRSADGPQATRIRKERSGRPEPVFLLDAGETREAVIRGFAIENPFGPGIKARGASPTIEENWFPDCDGAAISCEGGSPRIAGGRVELSSGVYFKGCDAEVEALEIARCLGGISVVEGRLVARACRLTACDYDGLSARSAELRVERCLIAGNSGGGLKALSCTGSIVRTTITGNSAGGNPEPILGGGVHWEGGNLTIDQCIIFGNVGGRVVDVRLMAPLSSFRAGFSDIGEVVDEIGSRVTIEGRDGCIRRDPRFLDPGRGAGIGWIAGDFRLAPDSPCLHAGDPSPDAADPDGTRPEMGAFPYVGPDVAIDTDGDGMPDGWERRHGLDPATADGGLDADADGLPNRDEYDRNASPDAPDTDGDGIGDADEVARGTTLWASDTDGDGADDAVEFAHGSDPIDAGDLPGPRSFSVPEEVSTIHEAIRLAAAGDTILVAPGEYIVDRPIRFDGKPLLLKSSEGPDGTTIRMAGAAAEPGIESVIVFHRGEGPKAGIEGFRIAGGRGTVFREDEVGPLGGGIFVAHGAPSIRGCIIVENDAGRGGGVAATRSSAVTLSRCLILRNRARISGGGISACAATIDSCTIADNASSHASGAVIGGVIRNSIVWGNRGGTDVFPCPTSDLIARYSCFGGRGAWTAIGCLYSDPLFVDVWAGDVRLRIDSPCIDAGDPAADDPDGSRIDIGARPCVDPSLEIDTDADGLPDWWERRYAFDPQDPADGGSDADGDSLANREERAQRTEPRVSDTDGDGLSDGREVLDTKTFPWEADSDGDGAGDAIEVAGGADPLDPLSFPSDVEGLLGMPICEDAVVFLLDRSYPMAVDLQGRAVPCLAEARWLLAVAISSLRPEQRFGVIAYEDAVEAFADSLVPADPARKRAARDWVLSFEAGGMDCLGDALDAASALLAAEAETKAIYVLSTLGLSCLGSVPRFIHVTCAEKLARIREEQGATAHIVFFKSCARRYADSPMGPRDGAFLLVRSGRGRLLHWEETSGFLPAYIRGEANGDWQVDLGDAIAILSYLFAGGPAPVTGGAAEVSGDGQTDLGDAIYLLSFLFSSGPAPPAPFPEPDARPATSFLRPCKG